MRHTNSIMQIILKKQVDLKGLKSKGTKYAQSLQFFKRNICIKDPTAHFCVYE